MEKAKNQNLVEHLKALGIAQQQALPPQGMNTGEISKEPLQQRQIEGVNQIVRFSINYF